MHIRRHAIMNNIIFIIPETTTAEPDTNHASFQILKKHNNVWLK